MNFGNINWNIPPAEQWCDHSATITGGGGGETPTISGFTPDSGEPGTSVTITGINFPADAASITVKVGDAVATISGGHTSTQITIPIPSSLGNSSYRISVTTPGGTATSVDRFTVIVVSPLGNAAIKRVASGVNHACAILEDGSVKCWGGNGSGQLGNGSTSSTPNAEIASGLANAIDIAAGNAFSCAVVGAAPEDMSGAVKCWGEGSLGQLGNNSNAGSSMPVAAGSLSTAIQISARSNHACAVLSTGQVMCWGEGTSGQLGNNTLENSPVPVAASGIGPDFYDLDPPITKAFQVSTGNAHTCARVSTSNGSDGLGAKCWGATNHGELGNGASLCQVGTICDPKNPNPLPQKVSTLTNALHLAVGGHHSCVTRTSGAPFCWGMGDQGQLGNNATLRSSTPVLVSGIAANAATHASAGDRFSCASVAGTLKCWGANDAGQLGDGLTENSKVPVTATVIAPDAYAPDTLSGGDLETCMKRTDSSVFCFP